MFSDSYKQNTQQNPSPHRRSVYRHIIVSLLIACSAATGSDTGWVKGSGCLTVIARTSSSVAGVVRFALFNTAKALSWNDSALLAVELPVVNRSAVWHIPSLPRGRYALALFHDINCNRALDKNLIGLPTEPYGFSNNARTSMGPPAINEAEFILDANKTVVEISVR